MLPEWLWLMLLLGNTGSGSSLMNHLHVHVMITLLRWECTFYMGVHDIRSFGTPKGNLLKMLSCFLSSIQEHFASKKASHRFSFLNLLFYILPGIVLHHPKYCSVSFPFFSFSCYLSNYVVIIMAYHHIPCQIPSCLLSIEFVWFPEILEIFVISPNIKLLCGI